MAAARRSSVCHYQLERWVLAVFVVAALAQDIDSDVPDQAATEEIASPLAKEAPGGDLKPEDTVVSLARPDGAASMPKKTAVSSPPPPSPRKPPARKPRPPAPRPRAAQAPARRLAHDHSGGSSVKVATKEALPNVILASSLLEKLGMSQDAHDISANTTAIADIALYESVRKVQQWGSGGIAATGIIDSIALKETLKIAQQTGVPEAELDATSNAIFSAVQARLVASATALDSNHSSQDAEDFAHAIQFGHSMGYTEEQISASREHYKGLMQAAFNDKDMYFLESLVEFADNAEVKIAGPHLSLVSSLRRIRSAAEEEGCEMQKLLNQLRTAHRSEFNSTTEAADLEAKTQACAETYVDEALQENNLDKILQALEVAREAGQVDITDATSQAQALGSYLLASLVNGSLNDASYIRATLKTAEKAGVPESEREASIAIINGTIQMRLSTLNGTSPAAIQELAMTLNVAQGVGIEQAYTDPARGLYQQVCEDAFIQKSADMLSMCVDFADEAGVSMSKDTLELNTAFGQVRDAAYNWKTCDQAEFPKYLPRVALVSKYALPAIPEVAALQSQATSCTSAFLATTMASNDLDALLVLTATEYAKLAGLPEADIAAASSLAQSLAAAELQAAANVSKDTDIKGALQIAARAGLDENSSVVVQVHETMHIDMSARLSAAVTAAQGSNISAWDIEKLAKAISAAETINYDVSEMENARQVFASVVQSLPANDESGAFEAVVTFADLAQTRVSEELKEQARVRRRVVTAIDTLDMNLANLPRMVEILQEAQHINLNTATVATLRSMAESVATDHVQTCQTAHVPTINDAIASAVAELGISQADAMAAQCVRKSR